MSRSPVAHRHGSTLVELLVTIAMLGLIASVATLAARRMVVPDATDLAWLATDSLAGVVARARPARIDTSKFGAPVSASLEIDGSIVADSAFHIDRLSGTRGDVR